MNSIEDKHVCRICKDALGEPEVVLNDMPLTDGFIALGDSARSEFIKDILIYECKKCGFVQNPVNFPLQTIIKITIIVVVILSSRNFF